MRFTTLRTILLFMLFIMRYISQFLPAAEEEEEEEKKMPEAEPSLRDLLLF